MSANKTGMSDMVAKGETAEVVCHFCGRRHYLPPEKLRDMLEQEA